MKVRNFSQFIRSIQINENSDLDWSDKNWDERGNDGENPPNNGLEGTGAFQADYYAGDYGETSDEEILIDDSADSESSSSNLEISDIKAMIDDLTRRINMIETKKK